MSGRRRDTVTQNRSPDAAALPSEAALRSSGRPVRVRFVAFGRRSSWTSSRTRPSSATAIVQRGDLPPHVLYKADLPRFRNPGCDFTNVDVASTARFRTAPTSSDSARAAISYCSRSPSRRARCAVIYRAGGRRYGLGPGFCTVTARKNRSTAPMQYSDLTQELAVQHLRPRSLRPGARDGLVADVQFGQPSSTRRRHAVATEHGDGIFGTQVA